MPDDVLGGVVRRLNVLQEAVDTAVDRVREPLRPSCRRGCAHCCHMPVVLSLPEALALVAHVQASEGGGAKLRALLPELRRQTELLSDRGRGAWDHFARQIPCVFLAADGSCEVYVARPAACRLHMVTSPADHCALSSPESIECPDLSPLLDELWAYAAAEAEDAGLPFGWGPLPFLVGIAFAMQAAELLARNEILPPALEDAKLLVPGTPV